MSSDQSINPGVGTAVGRGINEEHLSSHLRTCRGKRGRNTRGRNGETKEVLWRRVGFHFAFVVGFIIIIYSCCWSDKKNILIEVLSDVTFKEVVLVVLFVYYFAC